MPKKFYINDYTTYEQCINEAKRFSGTHNDLAAIVCFTEKQMLEVVALASEGSDCEDCVQGEFADLWGYTINGEYRLQIGLMNVTEQRYH